MGEAMSRLLQAVRLERDAFVWMDFNDRATADALIFVMVTRILILIGLGGRVLGLLPTLGFAEVLITSVLNALIFWLAFAGISFAAAKFLLGGTGTYAVFLRITGFAYPTLLLTIFTAQLELAPLVALTLGSVWFLAVVARGVQYESDLPIEKAALAALAGFVGWIIISSIFGRGAI